MPVTAFIKRSPWLRRGLWVPLQMRRFVKGRLERPYERAIDWLISSIEGDVALRVQQFGGTFQMSPHSDLFRRLVRYRSYEPKTAAFFDISVQPHKDIIDVGANIGFFTVLGARRLTIGRVLAIEPVEPAYSRLKANVERNGVADRVILFRGAAGAATGEVTLSVVEGREEYSSVGELRHPAIAGTASHRCTAPVRTVDDLVDQHGLKPAILKVDVEGAEGFVFQGATRTLSQFRPIVISELSNSLLRNLGFDGKQIVTLFRDLDYIVTDAEDPLFPAGERDFGDIYCVPRERTR